MECMSIAMEMESAQVTALTIYCTDRDLRACLACICACVCVYDPWDGAWRHLHNRTAVNHGRYVDFDGER